MPELESLELSEPEENQRKHRFSQPFDELGLFRDRFNIWIFLKRNAFVLLTMVGVAVGNTFLFFISFLFLAFSLYLALLNFFL